MRRREYLRSAVGVAGLAGLWTTAAAAGGADGVSPSDTDRTPPAGEGDPSTGDRVPPTGTTAADAGFAPLAKLDIDSRRVTEAVTTPGGRYAFVADVVGFRVVDLADPASPEVVATRENVRPEVGPLANVKDVKYNRGRVLIAADRNDTYTGIALFDVRDPTDPQIVSSYRTPYGVHNCDLHGDYAYLTAGSELEVVDVSAEPESAARWSVTDYDTAYEDVVPLLRNFHDVYVQGERAYLAYWDVGTWILDVSDPTNPAYVGHVAEHTLDELQSVSESNAMTFFFEPPGNSHYVQPSDDGTLLAVGGESWNVTDNDDQEDDPGGPSGVDLYDIADPANPVHRATIDPPPVPEGRDATYGGYWTTAHNFDIVGDYLYSSWYQGGVKVHDVSDPAAPEELAHWRDGDVTRFWTAQVGVPGEYFVATNENAGDESNPSGLYVFPDPTENPATVTPSGPPVTVPTGTPTDAATPTATPTPTPTDADTRTATPSPTAEPTPTPTGTPPAATSSASQRADDASGTTDGTGPGFGPLAALAGLGTGAWRLVGGNGGSRPAGDGDSSSTAGRRR